MTWISPTNVALAVVTGSICGLGINPLSSFDVSLSLLGIIIRGTLTR